MGIVGKGERERSKIPKVEEIYWGILYLSL